MVQDQSHHLHRQKLEVDPTIVMIRGLREHCRFMAQIARGIKAIYLAIGTLFGVKIFGLTYRIL